MKEGGGSIMRTTIGSLSRGFSTKAVHGNKYDYSRVVYVDSVTPVSIVCQEHGEFKQRPAMHLSGRGCPGCARLITASIRTVDRMEDVIGII